MGIREDDRWIYGEFIRKRWGVNERTLATIVYDNGLQAYDFNNKRLDIDEASGLISDSLKFKLDDVEKFELRNEHLFNPEQQTSIRNSKPKKGQWIYGGFLRKRWDISDRMLETFAINGLPAYDNENIRHDFECGWNCIDTYRFRLEDVEAFELENGHLIGTDINHTSSNLNAKLNNEDQLGKRMTADEVAILLDIDVKTVRSNYEKLGGMRLGRNYMFFERSVNNAIQKRTEMERPSAKGREETGEGISDEEGSIDVGSQNEAKARQRVEREDRHNLFG